MKKLLIITLLTALAPAIMHANNKDRDPDRDRRDDLIVIGLTSDNRLVWFSEDSPKRAHTIGTVTGLTGDTGLIGIDYRVQDGLLYGVGNAGGVYTLDTMTAAATLVSTLTMPLNGTAFGVDFNPAADRLRIVSNTGQNLRHNVNAGGTTLVDGTLTYVPPATALGIVGAAYTNNDLDLNTATTLFDLDATLDQIAAQAPANNGTLSATGKLTVDTGEAGRARHLQHPSPRDHRAQPGVRGPDGQRGVGLLFGQSPHRQGRARRQLQEHGSGRGHSDSVEPAVIRNKLFLALALLARLGVPVFARLPLSGLYPNKCFSGTQWSNQPSPNKTAPPEPCSLATPPCHGVSHYLK